MATVHRRAESIVTRSKEIVAHLREVAPVPAGIATSVADAAAWAITAGEAVVGFDAVSAADTLMMVAGTLKKGPGAGGRVDLGRLAARCAASACCFAVVALHERRTLLEAESQLRQAEAFAARAGAGALHPTL